MSDRLPRFRIPARCAVLAVLVCMFSVQAQDAQVPFRYDVEYPHIDYNRAHTDNAVSRLQERIASGEVRLEYRAQRGYLDSLLEALNIDPGSQTLVYSRTSLQFDKIDAAAPRAIYFNDDVYLAFVQNSHILELAVMDPDIGVAFYLFNNRVTASNPWSRESGACLGCHDSRGLAGGGVPLLVVRSLLVDAGGLTGVYTRPVIVTDATPLEERWGGWYVTGLHGSTLHRGNVILPELTPHPPTDLTSLRRGNLETLEGLGLFDTSRYPVATSDIVALLLMEHQTTVQNKLVFAIYKAPFVLRQMSLSDFTQAPTLNDIPDARVQTALRGMLDDIVRSLLFVGAIALDEPIRGTSGFEAWYQAQGPWDAQGRSLRELDLNTRLLKYPLSPLIYSAAFDGLPPYALDYIYERLWQVLTGADSSPGFAHLSDDDREAILAILMETKPAFAAHAQARGEG